MALSKIKSLAPAKDNLVIVTRKLRSIVKQLFVIVAQCSAIFSAFLYITKQRNEPGPFLVLSLMLVITTALLSRQRYRYLYLFASIAMGAMFLYLLVHFNQYFETSPDYPFVSLSGYLLGWVSLAVLGILSGLAYTHYSENIFFKKIKKSFKR